MLWIESGLQQSYHAVAGPQTTSLGRKPDTSEGEFIAYYRYPPPNNIIGSN